MTLDYRDYVRWLSYHLDERIFLSDGSEHALIVFERIFKQSSKILRIFAGNLCRTMGNEPEYITALSDFIVKGGSVRILLNNYDEKLVNESNLFKRLAYFKNLGKDITVKKTETKLYQKGDPFQKEIYFTVGDENAYRIESNIKQCIAQCSMNRKNEAKEIITLFDGLFNSDESEEIDLLKIFGY